MSRFIEACKAFFLVLRSGTSIPGTPEALPSPAAESMETQKKCRRATDRETQGQGTAPSAAAVRAAFERGALYSLTLFQREGRMVDFLMEDLSAYDDAQIGAAVRQIHRDCQKSLIEHFAPVPVARDAAEGAQYSIPAAAYDPLEFLLCGGGTAHSAQTPVCGVLRHKGWKSEKISLPQLTEENRKQIICPAELEF